MVRNFKAMLQEQRLLAGTMITIDSAMTVELLAAIDFDWLFIDGEHTPMTSMDIQRLIRSAGPEMPCLVRLEESAEVPIKKALDAGAAGIIAPMVNTPWDARKIVQWAKYAPHGQRGVGLSRAHGYGLDFEPYVNGANQSTAVIIQIEHIDAVNKIEAIVKVPGVDAVFVGPYDLSASLGLMGQVDHPQVVEAIERVTAVCRESQMPLGIFGLDAASVKPYIAKGYTLICAGVDTMLLGLAAKGLLNEVRSA